MNKKIIILLIFVLQSVSLYYAAEYDPDADPPVGGNRFNKDAYKKHIADCKAKRVGIPSNFKENRSNHSDERSEDNYKELMVKYENEMVDLLAFCAKLTNDMNNRAHHPNPTEKK